MILSKCKSNLYNPMPAAEELKAELRYHAQRFSFHKLSQTAKW